MRVSSAPAYDHPTRLAGLVVGLEDILPPISEVAMFPFWTWKQPLVSQGFQLGPNLILKPTEIHQDTS